MMADRPFAGRSSESDATAILAADDASSVVVDCASEEIRLPGSIQRHGFLLVLDELGEKIAAVSENAEEFLHIPVKLLLGATLDAVLDREILGAVRSLTFTPDESGLMVYLGAFRLKGELCSLVAHTSSGHRILEFEKLDRLVIPEIMNAVITNFVGKLSKLETTLALCQAITHQVQELTGFERVLLYSFDETGNGTVLAEGNTGALPSYLDLRFPATDIPAQARQLYVLNTVRIIPNATYEPARLLGKSADVSTNLDLSTSVLRSVSPTHLEYMRNMGTMSSMSISILCEGKLWGLISGHHSQPHTVPYLVRSACDMLTKMVGTQLAAFRNAARLKSLVNFHTVQRNVLTRMAAETNYLKALQDSLQDLLEITAASGAAIILNQQIHSRGLTPGDEDVSRLADWLDEQTSDGMLATSCLSQEFAWAAEIKAEASGLLAIRISDVKRHYILWFRPEIVNTVTWAGEPIKILDRQSHLHPRNSFEHWKETVTGQSDPWTDVQVESARDFRSALTTIGLKRAEEAAELSEARFQQLTHTLPALIWTSNDDGSLTYVNNRWRKMGFSAAGRWYDVVKIHPEDAARVHESWKVAVAAGSSFEEEVRLRGELDGILRWHLIRAVPFQSAGRQRAGWVGTFTDTTERREREAALRMTEKLATTGRMTSVIAHEINNPLESITNLMYLLRGELGTNEPALSYIALAESELERISGITKQTLRWGRERTERVERVDARAIFEDVLRLFAGKIRNRQVRVTRRQVADVEFTAVSGQIRQVIANLISNAVDAVPVGGHIWIDAIASDAATTLVVGDEGSGMSEEQQRQLFQPFFSTKGDLGNGLGLYISHEIVERHGGRLEVISTPAQGTQMRVVLPRGEPMTA